MEVSACNEQSYTRQAVSDGFPLQRVGSDGTGIGRRRQAGCHDLVSLYVSERVSRSPGYATTAV